MTAKHYTVLSLPEQMLEGPWLHVWLRKLELWGHPALPRGHAAAILVTRGCSPADGQLWAFVQPQHRRNTIYRLMPVAPPADAADPLFAADPDSKWVQPTLSHPPQGKNKVDVLVGLRSEDQATVVLLGSEMVRVVPGPVEWGRRGGSSGAGARRLARWMLGYAGYDETDERVSAVAAEVIAGLAPEFEESWARVERRVGLVVAGVREVLAVSGGDAGRPKVDVAISAAFRSGYGAWGCELVHGESMRRMLGAGGRGIRERNAGVMALLEAMRWVEREVGGACDVRVAVEAPVLSDDVLVRLPQWAAAGFADVAEARKWRELDRRLASHRSEWRVDRHDPGVLAARAHAAALLEEVMTVDPADEPLRQPVPSD